MWYANIRLPFSSSTKQAVPCSQHCLAIATASLACVFCNSIALRSAAVMFGDYTVHDIRQTLLYKQVRKKKRSLHETNPRAGRNKPNCEARRNNKNTKRVKQFALYDKVRIGDAIGWITGFTGKSGAYVQDADGNYIHPGTIYKQISLSKLRVCSCNNNWIVRCYI